MLHKYTSKEIMKIEKKIREAVNLSKFESVPLELDYTQDQPENPTKKHMSTQINKKKKKIISSVLNLFINLTIISFFRSQNTSFWLLEIIWSKELENNFSLNFPQYSSILKKIIKGKKKKLFFFFIKNFFCNRIIRCENRRKNF
jgi:hypothetical protein